MTGTVLRWIVIVVVIGMFIAWVFNQGIQYNATSVSKQDAKAVTAAQQDATDYDSCDMSGGVWDYRARKCKPSP